MASTPRRSKEQWRLICQDFEKQRDDRKLKGQSKLKKRDFIQNHPELVLSMESSFSKNYKKYLKGELQEGHDEPTKKTRRRQHLDAEKVYAAMYAEKFGASGVVSREERNKIRQELILKFSIPGGKRFKASSTWCKDVEQRYGLAQHPNHQGFQDDDDDDDEDGDSYDSDHDIQEADYDDESVEDDRMALAVDSDQSQFKAYCDLTSSLGTNGNSCPGSPLCIDPTTLTNLVGTRVEVHPLERSIPDSLVSFSDASSTGSTIYPATIAATKTDPVLLEAEATRLEELAKGSHHNQDAMFLGALDLRREALQLRLGCCNDISSQESIIHMEPSIVESYKKIATLQKAQGNLIGALATYHQAVQFRLKVWKALNEETKRARDKAWLVENQHGEPAALVFYAEFNSLFERWDRHPLGTAELLNLIGHIYQAQGNLEQAKANFLQALSIVHNKAPGTEAEAESYQLLGDVQRCQNNLQGAMDCFQRASDITSLTRRMQQQQDSAAFTCPFGSDTSSVADSSTEHYVAVGDSAYPTAATAAFNTVAQHAV